MIGKLGWKKQKKDDRDWRFSAAIPPVLPKRSSVEKFAPAIKDQGALGSCTAFSAATVLESMMRHHKKRVADFSELFLYYIVREYEGSVSEDSGCELRDVVKCLAKLGICEESYWPYKPAKFRQKPPSSAFIQAMEYQILTYEAIRNLDEMKTCIAEVRHPFLFGFYVYESFENVGPDGLMPMPKRGEQILGGHAVTAVGYNDKTQLFTIQNSWGPAWGKGGKFYMPYDFITNPKYAMDFWRITRGEQM